MGNQNQQRENERSDRDRHPGQQPGNPGRNDEDRQRGDPGKGPRDNEQSQQGGGRRQDLDRERINPDDGFERDHDGNRQQDQPGPGRGQ
jgi:hypothetical protein